VKIFNAETFGIRIKNKAFKGKVHSVFASACNIKTREDKIITLLVNSKPDQPNGIRIVTPKEFVFSDWIKPGDSVSCQQECLQIEEPNILVDMRLAHVWQNSLPRYLDDVDHAHILGQYKAATKLFLMLTKQNIDSLKKSNSKIKRMDFLPILYSKVENLTQSVRIDDKSKILSEISSFIGFGPGLTPWGDDFLCGFMAGFDCLSKDLDQKIKVHKLRDILIRNFDATGDISKSMLSDAVLGQHGELIVDTCQALFDPKFSPKLTSRVCKLIEVGETSGSASCLGILSGIAAVTKCNELYKVNFLRMMLRLKDKVYVPHLETVP